MTFTYDLNTNGCLIIRADTTDRKALRELRKSYKGKPEANMEADALESLIANSELDWVSPEEIAALTDAPILGIRNEKGEVDAAWGYMDYCLRSFVDDLIKTGKAVFTS